MSSKRQELRRELGTAVRELQQAVDAFDEAVAAHLGVNRTDLRCLDVLLQFGPAPAGWLAAALGLTTGSVTTMLDRLERTGWLLRTPDPDDRRRVVVRATPAAERAAAAIYGPIAQAGEREIARYTTAELELLIRFMRRSRELQQEQRSRLRTLPLRR